MREGFKQALQRTRETIDLIWAALRLRLADGSAGGRRRARPLLPRFTFGPKQSPRADVRQMLARLFPAAVVDPPHRAGTGDAWVYRAFDRDGSKTLVIPDAIRADAMTDRLVEVTESRVEAILGQPGQRWAEFADGENGILVEERSRRDDVAGGAPVERQRKGSRGTRAAKTLPRVVEKLPPLARGAQQGRWNIRD